METQAPIFQHDLLSAVQATLELYATRTNRRLDPTTIARGVDEFMQKIQDAAFRTNTAMQQNVNAVAEYLWTSGKKDTVVDEMELCNVLNAVIRDDIEEEIQDAIIIFRSINSRCVTRTNGTCDEQSYPPNGDTWRGSGFRRQFQAFFERMVGEKYRVPGFLATSSKRETALAFAFDTDADHPCAMWHVMFDKRGLQQVEYRCRHVTFVSNASLEGESEYLFAPYSVFTLESVRWSTELRKPHEFTILSAVDNQEEDENLPLTPWY